MFGFLRVFDCASVMFFGNSTTQSPFLISKIFTLERPMGFGLKGERVANTPTLLLPPRRGGRTVGDQSVLSTLLKPQMSHKCEKFSSPRRASLFLYFSSKTILPYRQDHFGAVCRI